MMPKRRNRKRKPAEQGPTPTAADYFKDLLGWKPSQRPFDTSANRA